MSGVYRSYGQFVLLLTALAAILMSLGFVATRRLGGSGALPGMFWGCGLSWCAAVLGGLPQFLGRRSPQAAGTLLLSSLAIRMGITLFGVLAILLSIEVPRPAFLLWVVVSYLAFLILDVALVLSHSRTQ